MNESSKITTFEECENSWIGRSITLYDYAEYTPNAIDMECTLWTGKSFEKKLPYELTSDQKKAAEIATAHLSFPVTIVDVKKLECEGCFSVTFQRDDNSQQITKIINNWKYELNQTQQNTNIKPFFFPTSLFFPTQKKPATSVMQALLSNKPEELKVVNGCFRVDNGINDYLIIWPYGFSFSTNENGIVQINNEFGQSIILVGDKVKFGGGGGDMSGGGSGDVSFVSGELPSDQCSGPYWILGEIIEPKTIEPTFGDDSEINKSCSVNSDCKLPMSYAIRSNCPYEMKCLKFKCTVICPWDEEFHPKTTGNIYFDDLKLANNTSSFLIKTLQQLTEEQIQILRDTGVRKLSNSEIKTVYHSLVEEDKVKEVENLDFVKVIHLYQIKLGE